MEDSQDLIKQKINEINILVSTQIEDLSIEDLEDLKCRHDMLLKQFKFWEENFNRERSIYDLNDFTNWINKLIEKNI